MSLTDDDLAAIVAQAKTADDLAFVTAARRDVPKLVEEVRSLRAILTTTELSLKILRETHDANVRSMEALVKTAERFKSALVKIAAGCTANGTHPETCPACRAKKALQA